VRPRFGSDNCYPTQSPLEGSYKISSYIGGERKKIHFQLLRDFGSLEKGDSKSVTIFNGQCHKSYLEIRKNGKPSKVSTMFIYVIGYDSQFSLFLRERCSLDLDAMFDHAIEIENNMVASNMLFISPPKSLKRNECGK
jgi:hypothetical protein